ncbi:hypothetical protein M513_08864, partial [Trichuris suis]
MESRNRIDSSMPRIPFATVAGDGWYNEHLDLRWSNFVELVFTGSQPPPPHQLAEVQRQRASVRATAKSMRVLCLGPHRLDGLGVRPSGRLHEVQRVVDAQVLELMFSKAAVRPPPVCYNGSPRPHMTYQQNSEYKLSNRFWGYAFATLLFCMICFHESICYDCMSCSASYIGETGNSLFHRHDQHLSSFNHYNHAISELNGTNTKRRGRPRKTKPEEAIDEAVKASAIVEHASWRDGQLLPRTIHCKRDFKLRKIKEALYIRHNHVINRDKGKDVSDIWTNLILGNQLCTTST